MKLTKPRREVEGYHNDAVTMETNHNEQKVNEGKKIDLTLIEEFLKEIINPEELATVLDRIIIDYSLLLIRFEGEGKIIITPESHSDINFLVQLRDIFKTT